MGIDSSPRIFISMQIFPLLLLLLIGHNCRRCRVWRASESGSNHHHSICAVHKFHVWGAFFGGMKRIPSNYELAICSWTTDSRKGRPFLAAALLLIQWQDSPLLFSPHALFYSLPIDGVWYIVAVCRIECSCKFHSVFILPLHSLSLCFCCWRV